LWILDFRFWIPAPCRLPPISVEHKEKHTALDSFLLLIMAAKETNRCAVSNVERMLHAFHVYVN
jgi:hypothetical protein